MRVLILAPQVPWPLTQGTAIRNFHVACQLAKRHDVTLVGFGDPTDQYETLAARRLNVVASPPPPARSLVRRLAELPLQPTPDLARRLLDAEMTRAVERLIGGDTSQAFEVVQIEGLEMSLFGMRAASLHAERGRRCRLIYDAHNAEWVLQHRAWQADMRRLKGLPGAGYSLLQTLKLRRYERRLLNAAHATVAVSIADAAALRAVAPAAKIAVVPNGVDVEECRPSLASAEDDSLAVFVGKMDFRPNIDAVDWFCGTVWPRVMEHVPEARLAIVGRDPVPRVRALARPGIEVTGLVEDVRPWLARAAVVVLPLRVGGGTRLKALEAMAMSKAIVATAMAVEGLAVEPGSELLVVDDPSAQAAAIVRLFADSTAREVLGRNARRRVETDYRWESLVPRIEALY